MVPGEVVTAAVQVVISVATAFTGNGNSIADSARAVGDADVVTALGT